jgi:hypothetical protein
MPPLPHTPAAWCLIKHEISYQLQVYEASNEMAMIKLLELEGFSESCQLVSLFGSSFRLGSLWG